MVKGRLERYAASALAWLVLSIGISPLACAEDECVANVRVTNQRATSIRVLDLSYMLEKSPTIHTQALEPKLVSANETVNWPEQLFAAAKKGALVTATAVDYAILGKESEANHPSTTHRSPWFHSTIPCGSGYDYVHYIDD